MANAIGPGDWVEFLGYGGNPGSFSGADGTKLRVGGLYQVEEIIRAAMSTGGTCEAITLVGIHRLSVRGRRMAYLPERFRPIYRPRADFIESLKAPSPARKLEDA
jgi:hypothetical protein